MANTALVKLYNDIKKLINNMATQITRDFNLKLTNLRIGEENIAANAVTSRTVAAQQIAGYHIQAQSISSEHLKIEVKNALSYPNRNYIKFSDESKLSSNYLIAEYETTELIYDLDYTIVIYGMVNPGQQIVAAFNDGEDMSEPASFVDGYAVLYVHTPEILENTNIRFYNYPASTAVIASIGWVCMYRGHLDNPPKVWNMPPEESGIRMSEVKSNIVDLFTDVDSKTTIYYQTSQPTTGAIGDVWYDIDSSPVKICRWNGAEWMDITDDALSAALQAAADAQSTADGKIRTFAQTSPPTGMTAGDVGDLWVDTDDNNKLYRWSGTQWVSVQDGNIASMASSILNIQNSLGSKTTIFYQMSAPTATAVGDIWYDIDASPVAIYRWNGSGWVDITTTALSRALAVAGTAQATADGKIRTFAQNEEPTGMTSGDVGDLWIDTSDNNKLYRYNGTAWEEMRDNSLDERLETAETTIDILGGEINAKVSKGYLSEVLRWEAGQGIILGRVSPDPEDTVIDMQLLNSVMNIRRNGVPVTWFGINGMSVVEGRVESSMNYGVYSQRVTADGGLAIG